MKGRWGQWNNVCRDSNPVHLENRLSTNKVYSRLDLKCLGSDLSKLFGPSTMANQSVRFESLLISKHHGVPVQKYRILD